MNKLLCFVAFSMVTLSSLWGVPVYVNYFTYGTDHYKDGSTVVLAGERYALVWVKNWDGEGSGDYFEGFNADATLVNQNVNQNRLLKIGTTDIAGLCTPITATLQDDLQTELKASEGTFRIYLLDTRTLDGLALREELGNGVIPVNDFVQVSSESASSVLSGNGTTISLVAVDSAAFNKSFVPETAPRPLITACEIQEKDGHRVLVMSVKKTVPYLGYNIATGAEPSANDVDHVAEQPKDGKSSPDEAVTFTVPLDENARAKFFKVIRN